MSHCFSDSSSEFVYVRSYSRWLEDKKRRETWPETVKRYVDFLRKHRGNLISKDTFNQIEDAILNFEVMPSMRAMWAAGPAADVDHLTMYNCSFANIDSVESFAECLYILMCGAGFGFSITSKSISKLPEVPSELNDAERHHVIKDSREGWADSVKELMNSLYSGKDLAMDYSLLRPKGTRLKTMGGRASGPEPLMELHSFIREKFIDARGRKLKSIECHDICNKIAEIVVVGGVRRSSEISLSDLSDNDIATAKNWPFPLHRSMANNSAVYESKPSWESFQKEWESLKNSGTGERGIFNLEAARRNAPSRRKANLIEGLNPCAEAMLRNNGLCNLSEAVVREDDTLQTLTKKIIIATIIGTIQSTFTNFPYLRKVWKDNCEEERLLGVSLTGIMDAPNVMTAYNLSILKKVAQKTAKDMSDILGINMPVAITCVKPSGTVSCLVNSASGMHPRYAKHYIRRYRISGMDPLYSMMWNQGFEFKPEVGQEKDTKTWVVEFPVKAPSTAVTREAVSALSQLELYKTIQTSWCEHNASLTVYVRAEEWGEVGRWVYENWNYVNGVAFLPHSDHHYVMAPYEPISEQEYELLKNKQYNIDYSWLSHYETMDNTEGAKSLACSGSSCEMV